MIRIEITREPLPARESDGASGAIVEFHGVVRGNEEGRAITGLEYECHVEMAERQLRLIAEEVSARHAFRGLTVLHRVGPIDVGEASLYVRAEAPHREAAFSGTMELIERLKQDVPIWKQPY